MIVQALRCLTSYFIQIHQDRLIYHQCLSRTTNTNGITLKEYLLEPYGGPTKM